MNKTLFVLALVAVFASALAVTCPDDDDQDEATYYPHETECGKFYECDHGSLKLFECPPGLYWDTHLNVCNRDVPCGDLSTSTTGPPVTTTEAPPPDTTEAPPPDTTEAPPPATTEVPPPATTEAPPPATTEAPPPATTAENDE